MRQNQSKRALHGFQFNVAQLLKEVTGATRSYDIKTEAVSELDEAVKIIAPITGHIRLLRTGSNVLVTGLLKTTFKKVCGRCLVEFAVPVTLELEEEFYPTLDIFSGAALPISPEADEADAVVAVGDVAEIEERPRRGQTRVVPRGQGGESVEPGGDELRLGRIRQEVAGQLLRHKFIVGQIAIEGIDDPVAVLIGLRRGVVSRFTRSVSIADNIKPVPPPTFTVSRGA